MLVLETELNVAQPIASQDNLKKIMKRTETWQKGHFRKINDHPFTRTPNPYPPKMDVLPKTLHIILAAKWLVQHLIPFLDKQRRPLLSLLSDS